MITNSMLFTNETDAALFKIALQEMKAEFAVDRMLPRNNPGEVLAKFTLVVNPMTAVQQGWELARMVDFVKLKVANNDAFYSDRLDEYSKDFDGLFTVLENENTFAGASLN